MKFKRRSIFNVVYEGDVLRSLILKECGCAEQEIDIFEMKESWGNKEVFGVDRRIFNKESKPIIDEVLYNNTTYYIVSSDKDAKTKLEEQANDLIMASNVCYWESMSNPFFLIITTDKKAIEDFKILLDNDKIAIMIKNGNLVLENKDLIPESMNEKLIINDKKVHHIEVKGTNLFEKLKNAFK